MTTQTDRPDLAGLLTSWQVHLRAQRKGTHTIRIYTTGVDQYLSWCADRGLPAVIDREQVQAFVADLLDAGKSPMTVRTRLVAVKLFASWLVDEGELPYSPLAGMRGPKVDAKVVDALTEDDLRLLIKTCKGGRFTDRRDEAIIRLLTETGIRRHELIGMRVDDVNVAHGSAVIRRGKGGKGRRVPFGPLTARALDRYLRARKAHRFADSPQLWLGGHGQTFGSASLYKALRARGEAAGIPGVHPHLFRHTAASRWLDAGGTEAGLMAVAGWARHEMLTRYTRSRSETRAAEEARRLNLGEF